MSSLEINSEDSDYFIKCSIDKINIDNIDLSNFDPTEIVVNYKNRQKKVTTNIFTPYRIVFINKNVFIYGKFKLNIDSYNFINTCKIIQKLENKHIQKYKLATLLYNTADKICLLIEFKEYWKCLNCIYFNDYKNICTNKYSTIQNVNKSTFCSLYYRQ